MADFKFKRKYATSYDYYKDVATHSGVADMNVLNDEELGRSYAMFIADKKLHNPDVLNTLKTLDTSYLSNTDIFLKQQMAVGDISEDEFINMFENPNEFKATFGNSKGYFDHQAELGFKQKAYENLNWFDKTVNYLGYLGGKGLSSALNAVEGLVDFFPAIFGAEEFVAKDLFGGDALDEGSEELWKWGVIGKENYSRWNPLHIVGDMIGSGVQSAVYMLDAVLPGLGTGLGAVMNAGQAFEETYRTNPDAPYLVHLTNAFAQAGIETLTEKMFGNKLIKGDKGFLDGAMSSLKQNGLKRFFKAYGEEAIEEAVAEAFQPLIQEWANNYGTGNKSNLTVGQYLENIVYASVLGGLTGLVGEAGGRIRTAVTKSQSPWQNLMREGKSLTTTEIMNLNEIFSGQDKAIKKALDGKVARLAAEKNVTVEDIETQALIDEEAGITSEYVKALETDVNNQEIIAELGSMVNGMIETLGKERFTDVLTMLATVENNKLALGEQFAAFLSPEARKISSVWTDHKDQIDKYNDAHPEMQIIPYRADTPFIKQQASFVEKFKKLTGLDIVFGVFSNKGYPVTNTTFVRDGDILYVSSDKFQTMAREEFINLILSDKAFDKLAVEGKIFAGDVGKSIRRLNPSLEKLSDKDIIMAMSMDPKISRDLYGLSKTSFKNLINGLNKIINSEPMKIKRMALNAEARILKNVASAARSFTDSRYILNLSGAPQQLKDHIEKNLDIQEDEEYRKYDPYSEYQLFLTKEQCGEDIVQIISVETLILDSVNDRNAVITSGLENNGNIVLPFNEADYKPEFISRLKKRFNNEDLSFEEMLEWFLYEEYQVIWSKYKNRLLYAINLMEIIEPDIVNIRRRLAAGELINIEDAFKSSNDPISKIIVDKLLSNGGVIRMTTPIEYASYPRASGLHSPKVVAITPKGLRSRWFPNTLVHEIAHELWYQLGVYTPTVSWKNLVTVMGEANRIKLQKQLKFSSDMTVNQLANWLYVRSFNEMLVEPDKSLQDRRTDPPGWIDDAWSYVYLEANDDGTVNLKGRGKYEHVNITNIKGVDLRREDSKYNPDISSDKNLRRAAAISLLAEKTSEDKSAYEGLTNKEIKSYLDLYGITKDDIDAKELELREPPKKQPKKEETSLTVPKKEETDITVADIQSKETVLALQRKNSGIEENAPVLTKDTKITVEVLKAINKKPYENNNSKTALQIIKRIQAVGKTEEELEVACGKRFTSSLLYILNLSGYINNNELDRIATSILTEDDKSKELSDEQKFNIIRIVAGDLIDQINKTKPKDILKIEDLNSMFKFFGDDLELAKSARSSLGIRRLFKPLDFEEKQTDVERYTEKIIKVKRTYKKANSKVEVSNVIDSEDGSTFVMEGVTDDTMAEDLDKDASIKKLLDSDKIVPTFILSAIESNPEWFNSTQSLHNITSADLAMLHNIITKIKELYPKKSLQYVVKFISTVYKFGDKWNNMSKEEQKQLKSNWSKKFDNVDNIIKNIIIMSKIRVAIITEGSTSNKYFQLGHYNSNNEYVEDYTIPFSTDLTILEQDIQALDEQLQSLVDVAEEAAYVIYDRSRKSRKTNATLIGTATQKALPETPEQEAARKQLNKKKISLRKELQEKSKAIYEKFKSDIANATSDKTLDEIKESFNKEVEKSEALTKERKQKEFDQLYAEVKKLSEEKGNKLTKPKEEYTIELLKTIKTTDQKTDTLTEFKESAKQELIKEFGEEKVKQYFNDIDKAKTLKGLRLVVDNAIKEEKTSKKEEPVKESPKKEEPKKEKQTIHSQKVTNVITKIKNRNVKFVKHTPGKESKTGQQDLLAGEVDLIQELNQSLFDRANYQENVSGARLVNPIKVLEDAEAIIDAIETTFNSEDEVTTKEANIALVKARVVEFITSEGEYSVMTVASAPTEIKNRVKQAITRILNWSSTSGMNLLGTSNVKKIQKKMQQLADYLGVEIKDQHSMINIIKSLTETQKQAFHAKVNEDKIKEFQSKAIKKHKDLDTKKAAAEKTKNELIQLIERQGDQITELLERLKSNPQDTALSEELEALKAKNIELSGQLNEALREIERLKQEENNLNETAIQLKQYVEMSPEEQAIVDAAIDNQESSGGELTEAQEVIKSLKSLTAEERKARNKAVAEAFRAESKKATTKTERVIAQLNAIRYFSMLSAPSTWVKNITTNWLVGKMDLLSSALISSKWGNSMFSKLEGKFDDVQYVILKDVKYNIDKETGKIVAEETKGRTYKFKQYKYKHIGQKGLKGASKHTSVITYGIMDEEYFRKELDIENKYQKVNKKIHYKRLRKTETQSRASILLENLKLGWQAVQEDANLKGIEKFGDYMYVIMDQFLDEVDKVNIEDKAMQTFAGFVEANMLDILKDTLALTTEDAAKIYIKDMIRRFENNEALTDKDIMTVIDIARENPKSLINQFRSTATNHAKKVFFRNNNKLGNLMQKIIAKSPISGFVLSLAIPFARMAWNMTVAFYEFSPAGFISVMRNRSLLNKVINNIESELKKGTEASHDPEVLKQLNDLRDHYLDTIKEFKKDLSSGEAMLTDLSSIAKNLHDKKEKGTALTQKELEFLEKWKRLSDTIGLNKDIFEKADRTLNKMSDAMLGTELVELKRMFYKATTGSVLLLAGLIFSAIGAFKFDEDDYLGPVLDAWGLKFRLSDLGPVTASLSTGISLWSVLTNKFSEASITKMVSAVVDETILSFATDATEYSDNVMEYFMNLLSNGITQFIPTSLKQFSKTFEQTKYKKSSRLDVRFLQNVIDATPLVRSLFGKTGWLFVEKVDPYTGENVKRHDAGFGAIAFIELLNFISPIKMTYRKEDKYELEAKLAGSPISLGTGRFSHNGTEYKLDGKELQTYQKYRATYINTNIKKLIDSTTYQKASREDKQKLLKKMYSKASVYAKKTYLKNRARYK